MGTLVVDRIHTRALFLYLSLTPIPPLLSFSHSYRHKAYLTHLSQIIASFNTDTRRPTSVGHISYMAVVLEKALRDCFSLTHTASAFFLSHKNDGFPVCHTLTHLYSTSRVCFLAGYRNTYIFIYDVFVFLLCVKPSPDSCVVSWMMNEKD